MRIDIELASKLNAINSKLEPSKRIVTNTWFVYIDGYVYDEDSTHTESHPSGWVVETTSESLLYEKKMPCPSLHEVHRWLLSNDVFICIDAHIKSAFVYGISILKHKTSMLPIWSNVTYSTYDEALTNAIPPALDLLESNIINSK